MDGRHKVLDGLDPAGLGLEIGASFSPTVAGDPAYSVRTLDHLDQRGLIEKYRPLGVDTSRIPPVDYVWSGERYVDLVGETRFDWIVASHVVEHVPNLVGFFNECAEILKPGGVLSLVVPDKRREFDYYRAPSGLAAVVDAHLQDRRLSSPGSCAEFVLNYARMNGSDWWTDAACGAPELQFDAPLARYNLDAAMRGEYIDVHAWVFTPNSFRLLVEDLHALGLTPMRERRFHPSVGHEFHVQLSPAGHGPGLERAELAARALHDQVMQGPSHPARAEDVRNAEAVHSPLRMAEYDELKRKVEALEAEASALRNSTSWKVTAPLRLARRLTMNWRD